MGKIFNTDGYCDPQMNYMVDLTGRLQEIKAMVDAGKYFTINRARQYGKTTLLTALADLLSADYEVVNLDFQTMGSLSFENEPSFASAFSRELLDLVRDFPDGIEEKLTAFAEKTAPVVSLQTLFKTIKMWCNKAKRKIVLIIDEADSAANNQVFLDFLAQLRAYYLKRRKMPAFHSVILAGVYDIRNIRRKLRPDEAHRENSPWNIASDFLVEMSFSSEDIKGMIEEYEADHHTGMDIWGVSELIYEYTSGYPYLVSRICKLIDEQVSWKDGFPDRTSAWTKEGCLAAVKMLLEENNPLFDSMINKLKEFPELEILIRHQLFRGRPVVYAADNTAIRNARMFGFVKIENGDVQIANRMFETRLYNYFLTQPEVQNSEMYHLAVLNRNQFIRDGQLCMEHILEKFIEYFDDIYGDQEQKFYEEDGRRYFMLFLKPIINGAGNYYIEARTRNQERTDLIIDYQGVQYIVELKVWRGNAYHERGEEQLAAYLDHYHLKKGYMLSFNFNKKKETGLREILLGDKILIEAVV